ncbi:unnamed protein product [Periconia digitata]|uniref:Uncharacterized protein n=1 Tax=Periconia digitata TaxID=1303443 RepID=A0A9W4UNA5_9PLEO|nr:unnamed protein product [Periconia digitata]
MAVVSYGPAVSSPTPVLASMQYLLATTSCFTMEVLLWYHLTTSRNPLHTPCPRYLSLLAYLIESTMLLCRERGDDPLDYTMWGREIFEHKLQRLLHKAPAVQYTGQKKYHYRPALKPSIRRRGDLFQNSELLWVAVTGRIFLLKVL